MTPEQERMLKKGDKVVMHTCGEAQHYHGVWTCRTDEFITGEGKGILEQRLVFLDGFSGSFATEYLQFVSLNREEQLIAENERLRVYAPATLETGTVTSRLQKRVWDLETKVAEQDKELQRLREALQRIDTELTIAANGFASEGKVQIAHIFDDIDEIAEQALDQS